MLRCCLFSFSTEQSYEILKFNSLKNTKWKKIKWQGTGEVDLWALVPKSSPYKKIVSHHASILYIVLTDVLLVLCCLLYRCSSADCCTAAPLLLMYCWSFNDWCTAGPLLTDVPQVLCRLLYRCSSAADVLLVLKWLMYCWSSADWCTAGNIYWQFRTLVLQIRHIYISVSAYQ